MTAAEAINTIQAVRADYPRDWRSRIHSAWCNGDYASQGLRGLTSELQTIRNTFGPEWLCGVGFKRNGSIVMLQPGDSIGVMTRKVML